MLQFIFQWLLSAVGGALEILLNLFMEALDMDINTYIELFPFLSTGYKIFRGIGIGLAAVLSVTSLLRFLVPPLFGAREPQDTVGGILFKTFIAGGLIYGGNRLLVAVIDIAKIPYNVFISENASGSASSEAFSWDFIARIGEDMTGLDAAMIVFEFAVTLVIAWNIIKLMLEVCERYMMVGILLYTSPPFFAMVASSETLLSFRHWVKMFISSCVMMSVSVFFLKLILSGFTIINSGLTASGAKIFVRLLLMLATCKIAQKADSYLNQLGLGTAVTGGPLLDDLLAAGRAIGGITGSMAGRSRGSRHSVLGAAGDAMSHGGGIAGKVTDAVRAGKEAYVSGDSGDAMLKKMQKAFRDTSSSSFAPSTLRVPANAVKAGADAAKSAAASGASPLRVAGAAAAGAGGAVAAEAVSAAGTVAGIIRPDLAQQRRDSIAELSEDSVSSAVLAYSSNAAYASALDKEFAPPSAPDSFSSNYARKDSSGSFTAPSEYQAVENFKRFGASEPGSGASMILDGSGKLAPSPRAAACGISLSPSDSSTGSGSVFSGQAGAVADIIGSGYSGYDALDRDVFSSDAADYGAYASDFKNIAADTLTYGPAEISDRLLHNPNILISGSESDSIGSAAVMKLYPDIFPADAEVHNIRSFNFDDVTVPEGYTLRGGHGWSADIMTATGTVRYTGIDLTAYSTLSPEDAKRFTKRELPTGRTEFISSAEPVTAEDAAPYQFRTAFTPRVRGFASNKRARSAGDGRRRN